MVKKARTLLPKLRRIDYKNKKYKYKLKNSTRRRRMAINEGVLSEKKKTNKTLRRAAIAKKGRFNILRIYRKNKKPRECNIITQDMRYMDRKYNLGKTINICNNRSRKTKKNKSRKNKTKKSK
tara:strand:+ start:388 stop:756 length:369 start_codon:yes stop_codon:yes gene_type:complete